MLPKFLVGLSLVVGMFVLMHALFSEDRHQTSAHSTLAAKPTRRSAPRGKQMAYMAFGSSLLIYGLAEVILRGM